MSMIKIYHMHDGVLKGLIKIFLKEKSITKFISLPYTKYRFQYFKICKYCSHNSLRMVHMIILTDDRVQDIVHVVV